MSSKSGQSTPPAADVFSARCPSRAALDLIAHTWAVLVASSLVDGPKRHSRLCAQIGGISKKALTQTLRELERSGLVERRIYPEVPPRVEYSLTPLGHSLRGPLSALTAWAEANAGPVVEARTRHARPGSAVGSDARA
jgi:DNA-binding HxlR family transcriptional regulator